MTAATTAMAATTALPISRSNQARGEQRGEERDFRKFHHMITFFYQFRCGSSRLGSSVS